MNSARNEPNLNKLIESFDTDQRFIRSEAYPDGGSNMLFPRLERAVLNQIDDGDATLSRYAIWANTVRDHISAGIRLIEAGEVAEGKKLLIHAHNSLSAFSEVQSQFDPR